MIDFRLARREDVPAVVGLLADDFLGCHREISDLEPYFMAFDAMQNEGANLLVVGEKGGQVIACYQLIFITGLSLSAARRAQIEGVRVAESVRGQKIGELMIGDAIRRARAANCSLMQFTTNKNRGDAHRFYDRMGFTPSHIGYKKSL